MNRRFKKFIAIVSAIAMVVSSMTVQTAKADIYKSAPSWMSYFQVGGGLSSESVDGYSVGASIGDTWWHVQTWIPEVNFTKGYTYTVSFTLTTSKPKWFRVDWTKNDTLAFTETSTAGWVDNGDGTYSYDYVGVTDEQTATSTQALRVSYGYDSTDADNWVTNEAITMDLTNFSLTREATGETEEDPTTVNDGWTAIVDGSTVKVDGWDLYAGMWNGGAMSYTGTTNEDLALKVTNSWNNPGGWGIQAKRYNTVYEGLEDGKTYTMKLSYDSTAVGTMFVKLEGANNGATYPTVEGANTHEIEFTYSAADMGYAVLELGGITAGTEISNINFQFEEVVAEETTTVDEEESSEEESSDSEEESSVVTGDSPYAGLTYTDIVNNGNNEFATYLKGSQYAVAEGEIGFAVIQYQNAGFRELYMAVNKGANAANLVATVNGETIKVEGTGIFAEYAADLLTYEYNVLEITSDGGNGKVVIYCPGNVGKGTYGQGGEEPSEEPSEDPSEDVETTTVEEEPSEEPSSEEPSEEPSSEISGGSDYAGLTYTDIVNNGNNEFAAHLKGSQYAVAEGEIGFAVIQYQNAGFRELYMAVNKGANAANLVATVNGETIKVEGTGLFAEYAADLLTYEYNVLEITSDGGNGKVVIYCPGNAGKGTYGQGGEEESSSDEAPSETETTTEIPVVEIPATPAGLVRPSADTLPLYFAWAAPTNGVTNKFYVKAPGAEEFTLVAEGLTGGAYDAAPLAETYFSATGEYTIGVTAVNEAGESAMTTITFTVTPAVTEYKVTIDGTEVATVEEGAEYTLPTDSVNGYVCGEDAYKAGSTVTVTSDMAFTSIGDVTVEAAQGAGIRYEGSAGIRFQATVDASDEVLATVTTGMIITANDIYNAHNQVLTLDAIADKNEYAALNVVNNGWYNGEVGTYCGSIVNIADSNYIRDFIAVAYATITYTDGTTTTVYSNMTGVRSIKGVAQAVQAAGYVGIADAYHATIDAFAAAK